MKWITRYFLPVAMLFPLASASGRSAVVHVPFVGCPSDGQQGPLPAPTGKPKLVHLSSVVAGQLAYYRAEMGPGVLAPRGWSCFGTIGSNGGSIYIAPQQITSAMFFSDKQTWKGFDGPAIQLSDMDGGTSGRFSVAQTIARVFPAHRKFVLNVIKEDIASASDYPYGPYPHDKLTYKNNEIVEYETPAGVDGLGTASWLLKNNRPIRGVALLVGVDTDCFHLSARLPADLDHLTSAIIRQVEWDAKHDEWDAKQD